MGPIACGSSLMCDSATEYCYHFYIEGMDPANDTYECRAIPDACLSNATCVCLEDEVTINGPCPDSATGCTDDVSGLGVCEVGA
jgi:hypothetical protein